ncbi:hypothetical protein [Actinokineospora inagensis]|uniref:hypothetical protein n=1 Tax=Actinokineospora inagensis TaxID=103730 RepID=UPI000406D1CB|nr:hypothetical protein [Actinokineospora inagensis]
MPDGGFEIDLKVLETHERELRALMDSLPEASAAASDYVGNVRAFGIVGQFLAEVLMAWTDSAEAHVAAAKSAGEDVANRFADMRQAYSDTDTQAAKGFQALADKLGGGAE